MARSRSSESRLEKLAREHGNLPLDNSFWRLNNLYWILDKAGKRVPFKVNWAQRDLFNRMWSRNLVLKVRQIGITTFYLILYLDQCLFGSNVKVKVIAHTEKDAKDLFTDKVKYAYENLAAPLRKELSLKKDTSDELVFDNGSSIQVSTNARGGTPTILHVTEFGFICAKYPHKAKEIVTGAMESVPRDAGIIVIESTAMGRAGRFYEMCDEAMKRHETKDLQIGFADYRLNFLPWFKHPEYEDDETVLVPEDFDKGKAPKLVKIPAPIVITPKEEEYFAQLEGKIGFKLSRAKKVWYTRKWRALGEEVKSEYPSTAAEAFMATVEGAYYASQMTLLRNKGSIQVVPYNHGALVDTYWDIGHSDATAIWFIQMFGTQPRVLRYFEHSGEGLAFYAKKLQDLQKEHGYLYGRHVAPHDMLVHDYGSGLTRVQTAAQLGLKFDVAPKLSIEDGIEAVRNILPTCIFDQAGAADGIECLDHYRKEWNEVTATYKTTPLHDWASHGADAFRTFAVSRRNLILPARGRTVVQRKWA